MDPTTLLEEFRRNLISYHQARRHRENGTARELADQIVECMEYLDDWLSKGGMLPAPWKRRWRR